MAVNRQVNISEHEHSTIKTIYAYTVQSTASELKPFDLCAGEGKTQLN